MYKQMRQRLAIGFTGAMMAGALLIGALPVAADDSDVSEPRDVNVGAEATGLANQTILVTNSVVAPVATGTDTPAALAVEGANDRRPDASDG